MIEREKAEQYLLLTLLSFAASITLTRTFLTLTGYPQLGNSELHIAHVLWGGLLLYVAALLPLLFANRGVYVTSAILAGLGVGLFIDEVGKFITQENDYFFPVAAPIVYVAFLLSIVLFLHVRRTERLFARDQLARAIEDIWESLYYPLTHQEQKTLKERLSIAVSSSPSQRDAELARVLLTYLEAGEPPAPSHPARTGSLADKVQRLFDRLSSTWAGIARNIPINALRVLLIVGLVLLGLLTLKNPFSIWLAPILPDRITTLLSSLYIGRQVEAATAPFWFSIRLALEVIVGTLFLVSAGLLMAKRNGIGAMLGIISLLLSLTTVNLLLFYFEQFSTVITTGFQFLLLILIGLYRRRIVKNSTSR